MSARFLVGDAEIWSPGSLTAELFLGEVALLEQVVSRASGFGPLVSDEVRVDREQLAEFTSECAALADRLRRAPAATAILEGTLATLFLIAEKAGIKELTSESAILIRERARAWM